MPSMIDNINRSSVNYTAAVELPPYSQPSACGSAQFPSLSTNACPRASGSGSDSMPTTAHFSPIRSQLFAIYVGCATSVAA